MSKLFGKIKSFDFAKGEVVFKLSFLDENTIREIQALFDESKFTKIEISRSKQFAHLTDPVRKKWFGILSCILKWKDIIPDAPKLLAFHDDMKKSMFEIEYFEVEGRSVPLIPSLKSIDNKVVNEKAEELIMEYSQLGCPFDFGEYE